MNFAEDMQEIHKLIRRIQPCSEVTALTVLPSAKKARAVPLMPAAAVAVAVGCGSPCSRSP